MCDQILKFQKVNDKYKQILNENDVSYDSDEQIQKSNNILHRNSIRRSKLIKQNLILNPLDNHDLLNTSVQTDFIDLHDLDAFSPDQAIRRSQNTSFVSNREDNAKEGGQFDYLHNLHDKRRRYTSMKHTKPGIGSLKSN